MAKYQPCDDGANRPKQNAAGPMLLEIENLTGEVDTGPECDGSNEVKARAHGRYFRGRQTRGYVEDGDHAGHESESLGG